MKKYNGLDSVKTDLAKIGICPTCGKRARKGSCEHVTDEMIAAAVAVDLEFEMDAAKRYVNDQMIFKASNIFEIDEIISEAEAQAAEIANDNNWLDTGVVHIVNNETNGTCRYPHTITDRAPFPIEEGCGNDDLYNYSRGR